MNINFEKITDNMKVCGYDLFIDEDGSFYKIKKISSRDTLTHNEWAEEFFKQRNIEVNNKFSSAEYLVHRFGFVYYSHDLLSFKPIIKIPNPKYYHKNISEEQLDSLFLLMILNNENPYKVPFLMGETDIYSYIGLDDKGGKVYEKNLF
jgi:hypothetical protein